ncbi:MAG: NAD+ synthase [Acidilobus sp.]
MARITIDDVVRIDYERAEKVIEGFIRGFLEESGLKGYVIGLSGGVDSATTYYLAVKAVGVDKVQALIMHDSTVTPKEDVEDAKSLVRAVGGSVHIIDIAPIVEAFISAIPIYEASDVVPVGNVRARIRMTLLYYYANKMGRAVLGTGDRSEAFLGYFTKYGDGGVDLLPIAPLLKSQVRRLALRLGVPEKVAFKPSSPRLWAGQTAEGELGLSYDQVDVVIHAIEDLGMGPEQASEATGVPLDVIRRMLAMNRSSEHKRRMPPSPSISEVVKYL